jgi:oxygen-dependent protoporphyrinogen oxidase
MINTETDVVIIGAGLTGLTTAYYLKKAGKKFLLIDKNPKAGGVISTKSENGFIYEEGPNTGVIGNTTVVELFDELSDLCSLETGGGNVNKRYILKNGKWHHLPMGLIDAVSTPLFTFNDKVRVLFEPFRAKGKNPHENLSDFVKRRLGNSFLDYAVDPFILGVYAGDPDYLIPKYALPKLYNLEQNYGSFIGGSIKKQFETKTLLEKRVSKKVFSFENGMFSLINALHHKVGKENFVFNAKNIQVKADNNIFITTFVDENGEEFNVKSAKVISTVGAYALKDIFSFIENEKLNIINNLLYTQVWEVSLGFKKWEGMKLDGFGGLIPSKEKRDILGILFMSSLFKNRSPKDGALVTIFMGGARRPDIAEMNESEIKTIVERECKDLLSIPDFNPDLFKVIKHNKAIPQYGIDSGQRFGVIYEIEKKYKGLIIGGNLRNGIGMADRIQQGKALSQDITFRTVPPILVL